MAVGLLTVVKVLALEGMHMLANDHRTSIAAPGKKVRRKNEKK